jgi:hypothetical protein
VGWLNDNIISPLKNAFSSVWEWAKEIFDKLLNYLKKVLAPIIEIWNKLFPKDKFKSVSVAYTVGAEKGSESFKEDKEQTDDTTTTTTNDNNKKKAVLDLNGGDGAKAAGDNKIKNINITIGKVVEKFEVTTTNLKEDASRIREMVASAIIDSVNDVNLAF